MKNCQILLIDTPSDITLLKESITNMTRPLSIQSVTSIKEAEGAIRECKPDMIMIGSSLIIHEGFEVLFNLGDIPIVILCESSGLNRFMKDRLCNVCFLTRPFDPDKIPHMMSKAVEFMRRHTEGFRGEGK